LSSVTNFAADGHESVEKADVDFALLVDRAVEVSLDASVAARGPVEHAVSRLAVDLNRPALSRKLFADVAAQRGEAQRPRSPFGAGDGAREQHDTNNKNAFHDFSKNGFFEGEATFVPTASRQKHLRGRCM